MGRKKKTEAPSVLVEVGTVEYPGDAEDTVDAALPAAICTHADTTLTTESKGIARRTCLNCGRIDRSYA